MGSKDTEDSLEGTGLLLIRNDLQLAYPNGILFAQQLPPPQACCPQPSPGLLLISFAHTQHLLVPQTILVHCLLLDLSLGLLLPIPAKKKGQLYGRIPKIFCFLLQDKARLFLAHLRTNQIYFFFLFSFRALYLAGFMQRSENQSSHFQWLGRFCSVSVLFVFLWLTVCCVSGLLTSCRGCSQAKESKTKPSCTRMGCLDQREGKGGRKGTDPPSLHSMQPCSWPHINSTIHMSPLIRDTGILWESLTMEFTLSGPKIPFLCLIDGFESLSVCSEAMDLGVINSDYQYPG